MWWAKSKGKWDTCAKFFDAWFMFGISENVANNVAIGNGLVAMITKTKHANKQHTGSGMYISNSRWYNSSYNNVTLLNWQLGKILLNPHNFCYLLIHYPHQFMVLF